MLSLFKRLSIVRKLEPEVIISLFWLEGLGSRMRFRV